MTSNNPSDRLLEDFADKLKRLKSADNWRQLPSLHHVGNQINQGAVNLVNVSSNDYLGVAADKAMQQQFLAKYAHQYPLGSSSSRLLTGNFAIYEQLEAQLAQDFGAAALIFNSGYHMNVGILPALCDDKTLILADKQVHASLIDGIQLAMMNKKCQLLRYRHNDLTHLTELIDQKDNPKIRRIIIITESIFSMDGDVTDLIALTCLKEHNPKIMLYVDEAHAVGVRGTSGLGVAQEQGVLGGIDMLAGTFGKAWGSVGAYVICHDILKSYLINTMRPLIFSTALPPLSVAWTAYVAQMMAQLSDRRQYLSDMQTDMRAFVKGLGVDCPSDSHIIPLVVGDNYKALALANHLQQCGYYACAIRHPTVAKNRARVRLCLGSHLSLEDIVDLKTALADFGDENKF